MQDLYPKVANFYSIEDLSYSTEEIKRTLTPWCGGGAVIFTVFMLAYLAWERAKTGDPLTLYSMICPLIGCPVIGAFGGYMLFALKTLGYIFWRAMQSLGLLFATSGSKNRLIRFMKNYEPDFGYENFANQVIALAKNIIFSEPGRGPFYYPRSLGWGKFPEHHGHCIQGSYVGGELLAGRPVCVCGYRSVLLRYI